MKKIIFIIVIALIVLFGALYVTRDKDSAGSMQNIPQATESPKTAEGSYVIFTPEVLKDTSRTRVLFFYANWCPTCRPVDKELQEKSNLIPQDVQIIRINYNDSDTDEDEESLAREYGITYQHTFVLIDKNGDEVKKWNGGGLSQILSNIN